MWSKMLKFQRDDPDVYSGDMDILNHKMVTENFVHYIDRSALKSAKENYSKLVITHPVIYHHYGLLLREGSYLKEPFDHVYVDMLINFTNF